MESLYQQAETGASAAESKPFEVAREHGEQKANMISSKLLFEQLLEAKHVL